jgi:hypothetical protein
MDSLEKVLNARGKVCEDALVAHDLTFIQFWAKSAARLCYGTELHHNENKVWLTNLKLRQW